jgi:hypothetical protein
MESKHQAKEQMKVAKKFHDLMIVFRKKRFLFFSWDIAFCECDDVLRFDEVILMKVKGEVIAILRKEDFSFALRPYTQEE